VAIRVMAAEGLSVKTACRMLEVTCGRYAWLVRPPSERSIRHAWLTDEFRKVHADARQRYGARRVHAEMRLRGGIDVGRGEIELLMQRAGLKGLSGRRKWRRTSSFATAVDLVECQF
jgi:putative transposase